MCQNMLNIHLGDCVIIWIKSLPTKYLDSFSLCLSPLPSLPSPAASPLLLPVSLSCSCPFCFENLFLRHEETNLICLFFLPNGYLKENSKMLSTEENMPVWIVFSPSVAVTGDNVCQPEESLLWKLLSKLVCYSPATFTIRLPPS